MADIEPPSFSLGLDFDFDPSQTPQPPNLQPQKIEIKKEKEILEQEDDELFNLRVSDSEPDSPEKPTLTRLRRLRRGGPSSSNKPVTTPVSNSIDDDDIEDFSDEDYHIKKNHQAPHHHSSCSSSKLPLSGSGILNQHAPHHHSSCSSSKLPLSGSGILMRQPESSSHNKKGKQDSSCPSTSLGSSKGMSVFPNLTVSPLRRFKLLDSESDHDEPSDGVHNYRKASGIVNCLKKNKQKESEIQARFKLYDSESDRDDQSHGVQINRKASDVEYLKNNKQEESDVLARFKLLDSESEPDGPSDGVQIDRKPDGVDFLQKNKSNESDVHERFKLLESDTDTDTDMDDPSDGVRINRKASSADVSINNKQNEANSQCSKINLGRRETLPSSSRTQDLWKDFPVNEKCSVKTPAFDEFCEEYFKTVRTSKPAPSSQKFCSSEREISRNIGKNLLQPQDTGSVVPPSHHYFFHDDLRIQNLVRSRLPYFCPLSTPGDAGFRSHNESSIDYMCQFGQSGAERKTGKQVTAQKSSKRGRKTPKNSNLEDASLGSEGWVNTKQTAGTPKDAGRRRVHADGQSAGQWFTAENGKKVYVSKNGKELTGRLAYTQYRRESGKGFKKSKKKGAAKKK